jgi:hypothetical protein
MLVKMAEDSFRTPLNRLKRYNRGVTYNLTKKEAAELKTNWPKPTFPIGNKYSPRVNTPKSGR